MNDFTKLFSLSLSLKFSRSKKAQQKGSVIVLCSFYTMKFAQWASSFSCFCPALIKHSSSWLVECLCLILQTFLQLLGPAFVKHWLSTH